nr:immunoglobulin heavy chain junction region [Mus musculus]MBK4196054.1 immunoglobulin heavy chain junction region [Mus musculus]
CARSELAYCYFDVW